MKKLVCYFLSVMMLLLACPLALAADAAMIEKTVLSDSDFLHTVSTSSTGQRTFQFDSGLVAPEYGGLIETVTLPGEENRRGTSLKIGTERESASLPGLNIPIDAFYGSENSGELTLDYDLYIHEIKAMISGKLQASTVNFCFYGANKEILLYWSKRADGANLRAYAGGASGYGQFFDFAGQSWYKMRLKLAWEKSGGSYRYTYNMYYAPYAADSAVCEDDALTQIIADATVTTSNRITQLRLYSPRLAAAATWYAVDNLTIRQPAQPPDIAALGYEAADGTRYETEIGGAIPHTAQKLAVRLTEPIYRADNGSVLVTADGRALSVSETSYDEATQTVWLTLAEPLEEGTAGRVTLTTGVEVSAGAYMPIERTAAFTVPEAKLQLSLIQDGDFAVREDNATDSAGHYLVLENGMTAYDGAGFAEVSTAVPNGDGRCLVVGLDETDPDRPTSLPRAVIELGDLSAYDAESLTLDCKIYIAQKTHNGDGNNFRLMLYGNSSAAALTLGSTLKAGSVNQAFTEGVWHSVRLVLRWTATGAETNQYSYDVYWDGELLAAQTAAPSALTQLTALRFYAPYNNAYPSYMALDDISLWAERSRPDILGFGCDGAMCEDDVIDYRTDIVEVYLSGAVASASAETVQLYQNGSAVTLSGVGLADSGRRILLRVQDGLMPNTTYEAVLSEATEVMPDTPLGKMRTGRFITSTEAVNLANSAMRETENGMVITADAENTQTGAQSVCLVGSLWRGNQFLGVRTASVQLAGQETKTLTLEFENVSAGDRVEISAWDSPTGCKLYSRGITVYKRGM